MGIHAAAMSLHVYEYGIGKEIQVPEGNKFDSKEKMHRKACFGKTLHRPLLYALEEWEKNPCDVPAIDFSDVALLHMVTTPSPYTKETVKVISI